MAKHYTGELTKETAEAVAANTNHCVTGFYFYKFLKGIQVGQTVVPIKVMLTGEFAVRQGVENKVITIREDGFFDEAGQPVNDILTINAIIADVGFKFGVRFKWENTPEKTRMYVN